MNISECVATCLVMLLGCPGLFSGETRVYKTVEGQQLELLIEKPENWQKTDRRPAVVFYFGGGWVGGSPEQFRKQSEYLATRGMVGIRVEYRTLKKGQPGPPEVCCADARSAMRFVRFHAEELGIDPHRVAAAGGSAGGHLAACTGLIEGLDDSQDDVSISCRPDALVLFNPVLNNGPGEWGHARVGDRYKEFSPAHNVTARAPPAIIFLGDQDRLISVEVMQKFQSDMQQAGVRCDLYISTGAEHGFFNRDPHYSETLLQADRFLVSLGWLEGNPTIVVPTR